MALSISPLMLALVVIIGLELIVVVFSLTFLLWRGRQEKRRDRVTDFISYETSKKISLSVSSVLRSTQYGLTDFNSSRRNSIQFGLRNQKKASMIIARHCAEKYHKKQKYNVSIKALFQDEEACIVENEVKKIKQETSSQVSSNPPLETDKDKKSISSSTSLFSSKNEEDAPVQVDQLNEGKDASVKVDELQKQNHEEDHNSRRLSISSDQSSSLEQSSPLSASSSSSVSHKDPIENEKCKKSDSYIETTDDPSNVDEPTEITNKEEKLQNQEKRISVSTSNSIQEQQTKLVPQSPSSDSRTRSFDLGGITLSLRIEPNGAARSLQVNEEEFQRTESNSSFTSSDSDDDCVPVENDIDDEIQVIRRYEMPVNEQIVYSSDTRQIDDENHYSNDVLSSDGENEIVKEKNEVEETIAGIINVTTGERLTICQAVKNGLIPRKTALLLLEAQAATGTVVNPRNGVRHSVSDAVTLGIIDEEYQRTLIAAEGAYYGYMDPRTGESISLCTAMSREIFPKHQGLRLLEAQIATGGIIDPWTGLRNSLSNAFSKGLLDRKTASLLKNREKHTEFFDPNTRNRLGYVDLLSKCIRDLDIGMNFLYIEEKPKNVDIRYQPELLTFRSAFRRKVTLQELIDVGLVENSTLEAFQSGGITKEELRDILQPFLVGENPIAGILNKTTNKVRTICQAVQEGLLRRSTALELLEAQAAIGSMVDPFSGKTMSLSKALALGLVDGQFSTHLKKAEEIVHGSTEPGTKRTISLFEAMKRGIVIENQGIRMLEAQIATGGIIDPNAGYRIPASMALEKGLFDDRLTRILLNTNHDMRGYFDPNTGDSLTYAELMQRCVQKKRRYGNLLLLPINDQLSVTTAVHEAPQRHRSAKLSKSSSRTSSFSDQD